MLAVLYDIHANLPALEAVLDDAQAEGADSFLLGGDYASLGAWPVETLARLRALPDASWLRGNWERWQGSESFAPSLEFIQLALAWVREALGPDDVAQLAALAETDRRCGRRSSATRPRSPTCARSRPSRPATTPSCSAEWGSGEWCSGTATSSSGG